jgi:hypothetical protein
MKITSELNLTAFNFWSGAKQHNFTYSELEQLTDSFEELYPEGMTETAVNDLFWFEDEFLCEVIGLDYSEYEER